MVWTLDPKSVSGYRLRGSGVTPGLDCFPNLTGLPCPGYICGKIFFKKNETYTSTHNGIDESDKTTSEVG